MGFMDWLFGGKATEGMPSQPQTADFQRGFLQDFAGRQAPTMNTAQADQTRRQQGQLSSMLFGQATGTQPGAGEMAVNRQIGQAQAGHTALASMARGAGAGMAQRNAARASADLGINGAGMAAQAQMQDQQNAQNQLNALLGNMRNQDISVAGANQQAQMQQQGLQLNALAQLLGVDVAALQQDMARRGLDLQDKGMLPTLLQIGGAIGASAVGKPPKPGA